MTAVNPNDAWRKPKSRTNTGWTNGDGTPSRQAPQVAPTTGVPGEIMTRETAAAWQQVIPKLETVQDVRKELTVLYALSKSGMVDVNNTSKMANMLAIAARMIETSDIEKRLEALEGKR